MVLTEEGAYLGASMRLVQLSHGRSDYHFWDWPVSPRSRRKLKRLSCHVQSVYLKILFLYSDSSSVKK